MLVEICVHVDLIEPKDFVGQFEVLLPCRFCIVIWHSLEALFGSEPSADEDHGSGARGDIVPEMEKQRLHRTARDDLRVIICATHLLENLWDSACKGCAVNLVPKALLQVTHHLGIFGNDTRRLAAKHDAKVLARYLGKQIVWASCFI